MLENITVLTTDLLFKLNPGHCYTVITDPLYQEILVPKLFRDISHSAYFVVKIPFNEDMLRPNLHIQITLQEARKAGCRCYLMFLANGIQMERFLRFIDRYIFHQFLVNCSQLTKYNFKWFPINLNFSLACSERAIDTRVKFLILHDYRLFGQRMHRIWRRFINVIFLREYEQHFRRNNRTGLSRTSFELSTVPFPYPIKRVFVTKSLDFWQNGKYRHGTKLNIDKTGDLAGG